MNAFTLKISFRAASEEIKEIKEPAFFHRKRGSWLKGKGSFSRLSIPYLSAFFMFSTVSVCIENRSVIGKEDQRHFKCKLFNQSSFQRIAVRTNSENSLFPTQRTVSYFP